MRLYIHNLKKKKKSTQHFIWSGDLCLETAACLWIAVLIIQSSWFPVEKTWGTDVHVCPESRGGKGCKLEVSLHRKENCHQGPFRMLESRSEIKREWSGASLEDSMLSYSKFENIQKRKRRTFWLRCSLSNCFWNLLIMTQNASPNLLSRQVPLLTKAGDAFYSILGWSKKRRRTRSSGPRRLRAGRAGGA